MNRGKLYDLVYAKTDKLFKKYNPCKIKCVGGNLTCFNPIYSKKCWWKLCCEGCKYWSKKGCTIKCLRCKLYVCGSIRYKNREFYQKLCKLERIARRYMLAPDYYITKRQSLAKTNKSFNKSNKLRKLVRSI